ncbi:MAG: CBS domain-containing protein, partial [Desulfobacterales bacterium]|nr:CBS domain-containing protein [Desulfobacterales bacterium]
MVLRIEDVVIRKVITIDSRSSITEATEVMHRYATSSLVVLSGKKIDGILSTRDVIARVVAKGLDPTTILVEDVMTSPVIMMRPDTPLGEAIKIMIQRKIKKLPLVTGEKNNARLVGLLSLTD